MMGKHKGDMLPTFSLPSFWICSTFHWKKGYVEAKHLFLYKDTSTWTYIVLAHLRSCPHYSTVLLILHNNISCHHSCCCLSNRTEVRCTAYKFLAKRHPNTCNTNICFSNKYKKWATDPKTVPEKTVSEITVL